MGKLAVRRGDHSRSNARAGHYRAIIVEQFCHIGHQLPAEGTSVGGDERAAVSLYFVGFRNRSTTRRPQNSQTAANTGLLGLGSVNSVCRERMICRSDTAGFQPSATISRHICPWYGAHTSAYPAVTGAHSGISPHLPGL